MKSIFQHALNYGAYYSLSLFVVFIIFQYTAFNPFGIGMVLLSGLFMIFWLSRAIISFRNKFGQCFISYKDAFLVSLYTLFLASSLYSILVYIDGAVLYPGLLNEYKTYMQEQTDQLSETGLMENFAEKMADEIDKTSLSKLAFSEFSSKVFYGTILCLILAAIFKRNNPQTIFDEVTNE